MFFKKFKNLYKYLVSCKQVSVDIERINELAFYINMIKNGMSVYLGDNLAITRLFTGQKMYVDTRDVSLAPHILLEGEWEPQITSIFRKYVEEVSTVFDIGANFGFFSLMAGTSNHKGSIHIFEANPDLIHIIIKNVSVNGLTNRSKVNHFAVTNKSNEKVTINIFKDLWGSATLHDVNDKSLIDNSYEVESITIDDYCKKQLIQNIDIIKLDIEGFEDKAYEGMREIIAASDNLKMFIEFTFYAYAEPEKFLEKIFEDFDFVYAINENTGEKSRLETVKQMLLMGLNDWIMLLCAKVQLD
ncbi:MAG: FkbM family methyltransferase [Methylovulum sp.]|uniref:FkbM family methyltransferase n=1 Tax=Methylovulum sp. TaxID=1916980 RepID=UPI00263574D4|nr:FkbM family methyltransferase [Methylovulum sp.]MDD2723475.1 FkbM family methyltransferase [Methylovulum sp.]MDD5123907.1 FkbM family methyltransferase [Methylovulum sp.]